MTAGRFCVNPFTLSILLQGKWTCSCKSLCQRQIIVMVRTSLKKLSDFLRNLQFKAWSYISQKSEAIAVAVAPCAQCVPQSLATLSLWTCHVMKKVQTPFLQQLGFDKGTYVICNKVIYKCFKGWGHVIRYLHKNNKHICYHCKYIYNATYGALYMCLTKAGLSVERPPGTLRFDEQTRKHDAAD